MKKNSTFFFDVETGGITPSKSSILSVSFGTSQEDIKSIYARPTAGTYLYKWSEKNVWQPIQQEATKFRTEKELLTEFIGQVKGLERGTILAGWNIGYNLNPVRYKEEMRGFDLPTIATRASKYGMLSELQGAVKGLNIRDIGQEYATRMARIVLQNQGRVDESIFEQAVGFEKKLASYGYSLFDDDISEVARAASTKNIRLAGWKQETIYQTIFGKEYQAHKSSADVAAGLRILEQDPSRAEELISKNLEFWNRRTVYNKLLSSARAGVGPESRAFQSAEQMWAKAAEPAYGLTEEFTAGLQKMAADYGVSYERLAAGKGIGTELREEIVGGLFSSGGGSFFNKLPSKAFTTLKANKGKAAIIGGVGVLALLQPGRLFSGRDDEYNTIEGLGHSGIAWQMRQSMTDFGSPVDLAKAAMRAEKLYKKLATKSLKRAGIKAKDIRWESVIGEETAQGVDITLMAKSKTSGEALLGISRMLEHGGVDLTTINIAKNLTGGVGKAFYTGEAGVLRKIGYKAGEDITSTVSSPITARWQMQIYEGHIDPHHAARLGNLREIEKQVIARQISKEDFPGFTITGQIPERRNPLNLFTSNRLKQKQAQAHKEGVRLAGGMANNPGRRSKTKGSIASNGSMMQP